MNRFLLPAIGWLLLVSPALAGDDILCLKDGRVIDGRPMRRVEGGVEVEYPHGKIRVPQDLILDAVLAEDAKVPPKTEEEKAQAQKGFVRFEGKWLTPKQRDETIAKRVAKHRQRLEEMKAHGQWRNRLIHESKYFRYEYTIPQHVFEPYRDAMEAYFAEFARTWKITSLRNEDRLPVCFYANRQEFDQVSGAGGGALAYFRHVKPWDLNVFYERLDPALTEDIMFHEANHYLQQLLKVDFSVPHFPGESLAEYYGASEWDPEKKKFEVGLIQEGRLCEVQTEVDSGEMMDLQRLITTDGMYQHYTWGWFLVHFLMNDPRYTAKFQRFFLALSDAKGVQRQDAGYGKYTIRQEDVLPIFMRELGIKDATGLRKLEAEWHDYIDSKKQLVTRSGKERAGFKAKEVGRNLRATRLFKEAIEMGSRNSLVFHELAEIYAHDGKRSEAFATWDKALEIDPLNGLFYSRKAFFIHDADKKECERLQALANEIGFDDPWVYSTLSDEAPEPPKPGDKPKKPGDDPGDKPN